MATSRRDRGLEMLARSLEEPGIPHPCSFRPDDLLGVQGSSQSYLSVPTRQLVEGLVGLAVPALLLSSNRGEPLNLQDFTSRSTVIYVYPGSSSSPDGGSISSLVDAAEHRGFRDLAPELGAMGFRVVGISTQPPETQIEDGWANRLDHLLLSDSRLKLADALGLPTFMSDNTEFYRRSTMIVRHGRIVKIFFPVESTRNPAQVLAWARIHGH
jgi:peroxiredoxin